MARKASKRLERVRAQRKKLREYQAFLKNDYDWDFNYILRLLQYKLERTRKCIVKNNIVAGAAKIGRQIRKVEELLGRVVEDRYLDEISRPFHKRYGQLKMTFGKKQGRGGGIPVTFRFTKETPATSARINKEWRVLYRKAERMQRSDLKRAFDLMHKNIWGWWD